LAQGFINKIRQSHLVKIPNPDTSTVELGYTNDMLPFDTLNPQQLLEAYPDAVALLVPETGIIMATNTALLVLLGQKHMLGQSLSHFITIEEQVNYPSYLQSITAQSVGSPVTASLNEVTLHLKHSLLPNGAVLCVLTPTINAEDATLAQAHSDFVSTVSHEFRTPLTSIKGFADTILRYGPNLAADQQRRFITIIKDQADRLTRMVENLLVVSKLGATGKPSGSMDLSYRPINMATWIDKVIQTVKGKGEGDPQFANREFILEFPPNNQLPNVWADPDKLEQILTNLIDNAVKYSYPGSCVKIAANIQAFDGKTQVCVAISDKGVGIPAEHLPRIFSKFSRIDNPLTRLVEGTGLGLYITHALTIAMGGRLLVTSDTNAPNTDYRTTFTLCLPTTPVIQLGAEASNLEDSP
jgi:signal transduction histidine kinase